MLDIVKEYSLIYNLTFFVTVFTVFTGLTYIYVNREAIQLFVEEDESTV